MALTQTIFLTGFMGSGKSFWGARLASSIDLPFYDLDDLIEKQCGEAIPAIFHRVGEPGFREAERDALHASALLPPGIVATGGGTPCFFDNMDWMNAHGLTIYLETAPNILAGRLQYEQLFRPLLAKVAPNQLEAHIAGLLQQRSIFYKQAAHTLVHTGNDIEFFRDLTALVKSAML